MATFEVGSTIYATYRNYDTTGVLVDTGTLPTLTITKPDLTTTAGTVVKTATGTYLGSLASTTLTGRYRFTFSGGTSANGGLPWDDVADVWPTDGRLIITLADAKAALNIPATNTASDDELRLYIAAANLVIENIIGGAALTDARTHTFDGGRGVLILPEVDITSVTDVTVNGASIGSSAWRADTFSGVVYAYYGQFQWGIRNVVVSYTVGSSIIPPNVTLAARELVRFWFQNGQQGGARPAFGDQANYESTSMSSGYAIPNRVMDLLSPQTETAI